MSTTTLGGAIFMWAPLPADPPADAAGDALYPQAGDDPGDGGWPMGSAACRLSVDGSAVGSTVLEGNSGESVPTISLPITYQYRSVQVGGVTSPAVMGLKPPGATAVVD